MTFWMTPNYRRHTMQFFRGVYVTLYVMCVLWLQARQVLPHSNVSFFAMAVIWHCMRLSSVFLFAEASTINAYCSSTKSL
jgi:hypothetical protein